MAMAKQRSSGAGSMIVFARWTARPLTPTASPLSFASTASPLHAEIVAFKLHPRRRHGYTAGSGNAGGHSRRGLELTSPTKMVFAFPRLHTPKLSAERGVGQHCSPYHEELTMHRQAIIDVMVTISLVLLCAAGAGATQEKTEPASVEDAFGKFARAVKDNKFDDVLKHIAPPGDKVWGNVAAAQTAAAKYEAALNQKFGNADERSILERFRKPKMAERYYE